MNEEQRIATRHADRRIETVSSGSGNATTVFVPGLGANARQFANDVQALSDGRHCIALSMRGHGDTFRSPDGADYNLRVLADDIVGFLESQDIRQADFVGNSLGGLVCYEVLGIRPSMVSSVTTFGTTAELDRSGLTGRAVIGMIRLLRARGMGWLMSKSASPDADVRRFVGEMMSEANTRAMASLASAVAKYSYLDIVASSSVPLLLLRGENDRGINAELASTLDVLARRQNATVLDIPDAGHFVNLERPECFRSVLRWFWASRDEPAPACAKPFM